MNSDHSGTNGPREGSQLVFWLTGLSGAGKTTVGRSLTDKLKQLNQCVVFLDGDEIRHGLSKDLGFSQKDRAENVRRVAEIARLLAESGILVVVAMITPLREQRLTVRRLMNRVKFVETFIDAPVEVCEKRDPKGLYKIARSGQIPKFTGISSSYEKPVSPELHIDTVELTVEKAVDKCLDYIKAESSEVS